MIRQVLRFGTAAVWLVFGIGFKILGLVPRHRLIVAAVVGTSSAGPVTVLIGMAEVAVGIWILTESRPRACAAVQTAAIMTMNTLELTLAKDLLWSPALMVCGNVVLLSAAWYWALGVTRSPRSH